MTRPWMGIIPPPRGQGYYPNEAPFELGLPHYFAPKPPLTTDRFTSIDFEPLVGQQALDNAIREHIERFYRNVDDALLERIATHMRSKGWTVEPPKLEPVDERPKADRHMLMRHAEKQGCSWLDAWNYFAEHGYSVDHLDPYLYID